MASLPSASALVDDVVRAFVDVGLACCLITVMAAAAPTVTATSTSTSTSGSETKNTERKVIPSVPFGALTQVPEPFNVIS
jgi:hypothetical protein